MGAFEDHGIDVAWLSFEAERIGREISDSNHVREKLVPLLSHEAAPVREGAIYGLENHVDQAVIARLREMAEKDPSPGVRRAARDMADEDGVK